MGDLLPFTRLAFAALFTFFPGLRQRDIRLTTFNIVRDSPGTDPFYVGCKSLHRATSVVLLLGPSTLVADIAWPL